MSTGGAEGQILYAYVEGYDLEGWRPQVRDRVNYLLSSVT